MSLAANAHRLLEKRYGWEEIGWQFVELVEETVAQRRALPAVRS